MVEYDNGQFGIIRSDTIIGVNILQEEPPPLPPPDGNESSDVEEGVRAPDDYGGGKFNPKLVNI